MGECVSYFLNETIKTLYNDDASAFLGVVAIDPLNDFNISNQSTTCRKRADNFATLSKSAQAFYKNFTADTLFPVGEIGTTLVDLYAINNSFSKLDQNVKPLVSGKVNLDSLCERMPDNLTLRQVLKGDLPIDNRLLNQYAILDTDLATPQSLKTLPSPFTLLKSDCHQTKSGVSKNSFMGNVFKYAVVKALYGSVSNTNTDNALLRYILQSYSPSASSIFVTSADDYNKSTQHQILNGSTHTGDRADFKRQNLRNDVFASGAIYNLLLTADDSMKFVNQILLDGNSINNDSCTCDQQDTYQNCQCGCQSSTLNSNAVHQLFAPDASDSGDQLKRDADMPQRGIGFAELKIKDTKFWVRQSLFNGVYSAMGFYFGEDIHLGFMLAVDTDDDQSLYELLNFLRVFGVSQSSRLPLRVSNQPFKSQKIVPAEIPDGTFLSQFLRLQMTSQMQSYVEYRKNLLAPKEQQNVQQDFYLDENNMLVGAGGKLELNPHQQCIFYIVMMVFSVIGSLMIFLVALVKKDQSKTLNLWDRMLILPPTVRQNYSKRYKQNGICFFKKQYSQQQNDNDNESSSEDFQEAIDQNVGGKCQLSVNVINTCIFWMTIAKVLLQIAQVILLILSLNVIMSDTAIIRLAFIRSNQLSTALQAVNWTWLVLTIIGYCLYIVELATKLCSVTWSWILVNLFGLISDICLISVMG